MHNNNTLFFNSKTGAMQECAMQSRGKCNSFRSSIKIPSRDQLFYDKRSNSMRTCMSNTINGKCVSFGMAPSHRTKNKNTGSYIVDSPVNPYYKKVPRTNTQLINLVANKHRYEFASNWPKEYWKNQGGVSGDSELQNISGSLIMAKDTVIGDQYKSINIHCC